MKHHLRRCTFVPSHHHTVTRLLQQIMRKGSRSRSPDDSRRRDVTAKPWTHDLYEEIAVMDRCVDQTSPRFFPLPRVLACHVGVMWMLPTTLE